MLLVGGRIAHPSGIGTIGPEHLAVDSDITLYARTFHVIGCDAFTREFMQSKVGRSMGPDMPYPADPHSQLIAAQQARDSARMHRPVSAAQVAKAESAHKFFSLDRKVCSALLNLEVLLSKVHQPDLHPSTTEYYSVLAHFTNEGPSCSPSPAFHVVTA